MSISYLFHRPPSIIIHQVGPSDITARYHHFLPPLDQRDKESSRLAREKEGESRMFEDFKEIATTIPTENGVK